MRKLMSLMGRIRREEEGQSLVEYGLIIALIAIAVIAVLMIMGGQLSNLFNNVSSHL